MASIHPVFARRARNSVDTVQTDAGQTVTAVKPCELDALVRNSGPEKKLADSKFSTDSTGQGSLQGKPQFANS